MKELTSRLWLRISTMATLSACFFVVISFSVFSLNMQNLLTMWGEDIQITAYLKSDLSKARIGEITTFLSKDPRAVKVEHIDPHRSLQDFQTQLASYAPDLAGDTDILALIPESIQIQVAPASQSKAEIEAFAADVQKLAGVEEVRFGQEWIKRYASIVSASKKVFFLCVAIILAAVFFVVGNAVRASVEVRRSEIEVLELVGASKGMIRKPFLLEGAALAGVSMALSLFISYASFVAVGHFLQVELSSPALAAHFGFLNPVTIFGFAIAAVLLGIVASWVCVRKVNTGFAALGGRR